MTIDLHLKVPEHLFRKVRAFSALSGVTNVNIESALLDVLDRVLTQEIVALAGGAVAPQLPLAPQARPGATRRLEQEEVRDDDVTGMSAGLGDDDPGEDDGQIPPSDPGEFLPGEGEGGLTEAMLDHDLDVENPQVEAAVEAPPPPKGKQAVRAEDLFASSLGADAPDSGGIRVRNKKALPPRRGRVVPLTHMPSENG